MSTETLEDQAAVDGAPPALGAGRKRAVRGSLWTIVGYGSAQVVRLAGNILLSRWLAPEYFGLMAIVHVFLQGLEMFSDLGIQPSIVQHPRGDERSFRNTAWSLQVLRGSLLTTAACLLGPVAAQMYGHAELNWLLPLTGLTALLAGLNSTSLASAQRHLDLGRVTLLDLTAQVCGVAMMATIAWTRPGVIALVAGPLTSATVKLVGSHWIERDGGNRWCWEAEARQALLHFGKWIFLSTVISFCAAQSDRLIVAKLIPVDRLGVYSMALAIAQLPFMLVGMLARSVLLPMLATYARGDVAGLAARLRLGRETLLRAALTLVLGMFCAVGLFFGVMYDERYQEAATIARWMLPWVWFATLSISIDPALLAVGDSRSLAGANLLRFLVTVAASLGGFHVGGLPGFLVGIGMGALAGHLGMSWALLQHGLPMARQDISYCLQLGAWLALALASREMAPAAWGLWREVPAAGLSLLVALWHARRVLANLRQRVA